MLNHIATDQLIGAISEVNSQVVHFAELTVDAVDSGQKQDRLVSRVLILEYQRDLPHGS